MYGEVDQVLDDARSRIREVTRTPRVSMLWFAEHSISTRDFCLSAAIARRGYSPKDDSPMNEQILSVLSLKAKIQGLRKQLIAAYESGELELNNAVTMGPPHRIEGRSFWRLVIPSASLRRWLERCDESLRIEIGPSTKPDIEIVNTAEVSKKMPDWVQTAREAYKVLRPCHPKANLESMAKYIHNYFKTLADGSKPTPSGWNIRGRGKKVLSAENIMREALSGWQGRDC